MVGELAVAVVGAAVRGSILAAEVFTDTAAAAGWSRAGPIHPYQ
jgi:hypothetical protein